MRATQLKTENKILNYREQDTDKPTMPQESNALYLRLNGHTSTDSKVRTTLYGIINSTTGKYWSIAFI